MALCTSLSPDQAALESASNRLLRLAPPDADRPAYTEIQLARRGRRMVHLDQIVQSAAAPSQPFRDEVRFLASVCRMNGELRRCLRLWVDGWSQTEIAEAFQVSQQRVSQRLRAALRLCYDAAPLSFRVFSHHTIYRPPRRVHGRAFLRRCAHCGESYGTGEGCGRFCCTLCQETARHEERPRRLRRETASGRF